MSGSGYVIETKAKPSQKISNSFMGTKPTFQPNRAGYGKSLTFPFYRKSFRSGSAFDVFAKENVVDRPLSELTLLENLLAVTGFDTGHEYEMNRVSEMISSFRSTNSSGKIGGKVLNGSFYTPISPLSIPSALTSQQVLDFVGFKSGKVTDATLIAQGTRLINATNPLAPPVTLAVSLAELLGEGLPAIIGKNIFSKTARRSSLTKAAGSEWLNYSFGITPIVSDIIGVMHVMRDADAMVKQWQRNNGEKVRRRRTWEGSSTRTRYDGSLLDANSTYGTWLSKLTSSNEVGGTSTSIGGGGQSGYLESYTQEKIQFSFAASFQYHLENLMPDIPEPFYSWFYGGYSDKQLEEIILYQHLVGLDQQTASSAETYWNVLPFSWLLDWFVNIGDLVSNITTIRDHGVLLDYGYISATQERTFTSVYSQVNSSESILGTSSISGYRCRRIRATPFGFGTTFNGLNPYQSSILASLATSMKR